MKKIILVALFLFCGLGSVYATIINSYYENQIGFYVYQEDDGFKWVKSIHNGYQGAESIYGTVIIPRSQGYKFICYHFYSEFPGGGYFKVEKNGCEGVVNKEGREIISPTRGYNGIVFYTSSGYPDGGYFGVKKNDCEGVVNKEGRELISISQGYDTIYFIEESGHPDGGYFKVKKNGLWGAINIHGQIIAPNKYASLGWNGGNAYLGKNSTNGQWEDICDSNGYSSGSHSAAHALTKQQCERLLVGKWIIDHGRGFKKVRIFKADKSCEFEAEIFGTTASQRENWLITDNRVLQIGTTRFPIESITESTLTIVLRSGEKETYTKVY